MVQLDYSCGLPDLRKSNLSQSRRYPALVTSNVFVLDRGALAEVATRHLLELSKPHPYGGYYVFLLPVR